MVNLLLDILMQMKKQELVIVKLEKIISGGQALGQLADGRKIFVWGGLPGETVDVLITKRKSKMVEGIVTNIIEASSDRVEPRDPDSYLSTSPWQIMNFETESRWKKQLVYDAFALHHVKLPLNLEFINGPAWFNYRNKVEFSWYWNNETDQLDLAFFRRGTHGKMPVESTSLAHDEINQAAIKIRDLLRSEKIEARQLKTLLIRCDHSGNVVVQIYVKYKTFPNLAEGKIEALGLQGFEVIFSNPKSPASVITKRLSSQGDMTLQDKVLDINFQYSTEGFFQVNLPVYELALTQMKKWIGTKPVIDMYSGVGTIGLTIGGNNVTLVENNEFCLTEMKRNIKSLGSSAKVVSEFAEDALSTIQPKQTIILDPPRAGLHDRVVDRLLEVSPKKIIYLSCNPVTQSRDIAKLLPTYKIADITAFNFFPRTPHIENLVVLESQ